MSKNLKLGISIFAFIIVLAVLVLIIYGRSTFEYPALETPQVSETAEPVYTPEPEVSEEPQPEYFTISLVGDNTLASSRSNNFVATTGGDMAYPYANTKQFFADDDMSIANLECIFSDKSLYSDSLFAFRAPTASVEILKQAGIEFVTTANNHTHDFGDTGFSDTLDTLDKAGIAYGTEGESTVYETDSGLKVGVYCAFRYISSEYIASQIEKLKSEGAEYIICALHWGTEGAYRPTSYQEGIARGAIDAGADLIYGSHPHVLQPVEEYGDGLILYSLGNWCFGGNSSPRDLDTAIVQVTVKRDLDGSISTDSYKLIPCSMSSISTKNDFQPTPYDEGSSEYKRAMSKLDGSFSGPNLNVDYSFMYETPSPATASESAAAPDTDDPMPEPVQITESSPAPEPVPESDPNPDPEPIPVSEEAITE